MKLLLEELTRSRHQVVLDNARTIFAVDTYGRSDLSERDYNSNVYCISQNGTVVWRIQAPASGFDRDSFTAVVRDGERIIALRESGARFFVDPETGELSPFGFER